MTKQEGLRVTLILNCIQKISGYNNIKMKLSLVLSSGAKFKTTNIWSYSCVRHSARCLDYRPEGRMQSLAIGACT